MAKVLIVFGSTSGNTEIVCQKISADLQAAGHEIALQRAELSDPTQIKECDYCLLAASTYGHGIIQEHMIPFMKEFQKNDWSSHKFAVIGLGDSKYDDHYNVESAFILEDQIKSSGGEIICESLKINKNPVWQLDKVSDWVANQLKI